jgi:hypothetical protein
MIRELDYSNRRETGVVGRGEYRAVFGAWYGARKNGAAEPPTVWEISSE